MRNERRLDPPTRELASTDATTEESGMKPRCNFCQNEVFVVHQGREGERCSECGSLRRHRVALEVYRRKGLLSPREDGRIVRVLHLAPEFLLRKQVQAVIKGGYFASDPNPSAYKNSQCLKLTFPDNFDVFPDDYFDYVIHNHVLEHIPGLFRNHLSEFARIIKPWGYHIFTIPGPDLKSDTVEGGELLRSGDERLSKFGQVDHVRKFGKDLMTALEELPNGEFSFDNLTKADRAAINVAPNSNRVLIWRKHRGTGRGL